MNRSNTLDSTVVSKSSNSPPARPPRRTHFDLAPAQSSKCRFSEGQPLNFLHSKEKEQELDGDKESAKCAENDKSNSRVSNDLQATFNLSDIERVLNNIEDKNGFKEPAQPKHILNRSTAAPSDGNVNKTVKLDEETNKMPLLSRSFNDQQFGKEMCVYLNKKPCSDRNNEAVRKYIGAAGSYGMLQKCQQFVVKSIQAVSSKSHQTVESLNTDRNKLRQSLIDKMKETKANNTVPEIDMTNVTPIRSETGSDVKHFTERALSTDLKKQDGTQGTDDDFTFIKHPAKREFFKENFSSSSQLSFFSPPTLPYVPKKISPSLTVVTDGTNLEKWWHHSGTVDTKSSQLSAVIPRPFNPRKTKISSHNAASSTARDLKKETEEFLACTSDKKITLESNISRKKLNDCNLSSVGQQTDDVSAGMVSTSTFESCKPKRSLTSTELAYIVNQASDIAKSNDTTYLKLPTYSSSYVQTETSTKSPSTVESSLFQVKPKIVELSKIDIVHEKPETLTFDDWKNVIKFEEIASTASSNTKELMSEKVLNDSELYWTKVRNEDLYLRVVEDLDVVNRRKMIDHQMDSFLHGQKVNSSMKPIQKDKMIIDKDSNEKYKLYSSMSYFEDRTLTTSSTPHDASLAFQSPQKLKSTSAANTTNATSEQLDDIISSETSCVVDNRKCFSTNIDDISTDFTKLSPEGMSKFKFRIGEPCSSNNQRITSENTEQQCENSVKASTTALLTSVKKDMDKKRIYDASIKELQMKLNGKHFKGLFEVVDNCDNESDSDEMMNE
ncbi:hypothetical protein HELRODRAFT_183136 [Helobdella robusta]|uniref:Uncharacterized protein n=1 Tax=Helobdella robusta TaxID=6412 RepID=T1FJ68_HELRO|nr:hypothetical protein HELRODRAFT_183136 [Helobdella robusta]ESO11445.1 hypothetical protein HELRODRAFT_183136 [Helobdella robusta]